MIRDDWGDDAREPLTSQNWEPPKFKRTKTKKIYRRRRNAHGQLTLDDYLLKRYPEGCSISFL